MMKKPFAVFAVSVLWIVLLLAGCGGKNSSSPLVSNPSTTPPEDRTISGVVSGLTVTGMVLQNNNADDLLVTAGSTTFSFATKIQDGATYSVTVATHPSTTAQYQACVVQNGTGTVNNADVTNVLVTCTTSTWEILATPTHAVGFSDYTPAGKSVLYSLSASAISVFSFPTSTNPQGIFSNLTGTVSLNEFIGPAWVGNKLYQTEGNAVYIYDITGNNWTKSGTLTYIHGSSRCTADNSGYVYSMGTTTQLLKFNTADSTFQYIKGPDDLAFDESRAAWDSKTARVYLGNYGSSIFYAFNPADGSFAALAPVPGTDAMSDALCSDRRGHVFTSNTGGTEIWMYTAATNSWSLFPSTSFTHQDSESCTVSADGWLYYGSGSSSLGRFKIF